MARVAQSGSRTPSRRPPDATPPDSLRRRRPGVQPAGPCDAGSGQEHRAGAVRGLQRPGQRAGRAVQARRATVLRPRQQPRRHRRTTHRTAQHGRRLRARSLRCQHEKAARAGRLRAVRLHRHAHQSGRPAAGHRRQDALHRALYRGRGAARAVQPLRLSRSGVLLRRDSGHRQADHLGGHPARGDPLPERQLRQGRAGRCGACAQAPEAGTRRIGHRRAQHRGGGRSREVHPGLRPRGHRDDQRLQVLRRLHTGCAQGRLRRQLLQRVLRGHAGTGPGTGCRRTRRGGQPGHALPLCPQHHGGG
jgi:hypothetical protein